MEKPKLLTMDAAEFIKQYARMCGMYNQMTKCPKCPIDAENKTEGMTCGAFCKAFPEKVVDLVAKWSKEHPIITNEMKFMEVFGEVPQTLVQVFPADADVITLFGEWWDKPYIEPKE